MPGLEKHHRSAVEVREIPPDGNRHEVVDGELLVSPGPSWQHRRIVYLLQRVLDDFVVGAGRVETERPEIVADSLEWRPEGAARELRVDIATLFGEVGERGES